MNRKFADACAQLLKRENLESSIAAVVIVGCVSAVAIRSYDSSNKPLDELTISAVDHAMKGCV